MTAVSMNWNRMELVWVARLANFVVKPRIMESSNAKQMVLNVQEIMIEENSS